MLHFNTEKCYSCNPMDVHVYVKQCKAWHDLYLMFPQLTPCWFVKYPSLDTCFMKIWLTTSFSATQDRWCLRLWALQHKILPVVQVNTEKCYSCNPMDFHAYVKQCKAWHDLYLMCPQLTSCWFVKYPSIEIVQWWKKRPMCRCYRKKLMNRRR